MLEKLQQMIKAYGELEARLGQPSVLEDQKEYTRLAKEHAVQSELIRHARDYVTAVADLEAAREILRAEADAEMKEFAQTEIAEPQQVALSRTKSH